MTLVHPHEVPDPEPCAPAVITDVLFPFALTALLAMIAITAALIWATYRFKISGLWASLAGLLALGAALLTYLATLTC